MGVNRSEVCVRTGQRCGPHVRVLGGTGRGGIGQARNMHAAPHMLPCCPARMKRGEAGGGIKAAHRYARVPRTKRGRVAVAFVVSCRAMLKSVRTTRPVSSNSTWAGFTCGAQNATRGRQVAARHRTHSSVSCKTVNFARVFDMFYMQTCKSC